jgi:hypothetical protein
MSLTHNESDLNTVDYAAAASDYLPTQVGADTLETLTIIIINYTWYT